MPTPGVYGNSRNPKGPKAVAVSTNMLHSKVDMKQKEKAQLKMARSGLREHFPTYPCPGGNPTSGGLDGGFWDP